MASGPVVNQGKGKFLRGFLPENRDAKLEAINAAWSAEGHEGAIGESLYNKIRSELGLTGKRGARVGASMVDAAPGANGKGKSPKGAKAKRSEKSPLPPDIQEEAKGPSKSAFVGEMLGRKPEANMKAINEAWAAAGNEGTISDSIFYKVKRERDKTGGNERVASERSQCRPSPKGDKAIPAASKSKPSPKSSKYREARSPVKAASLHSNGEAASPEPTPTMSDQAQGHGRELHRIEGEIDELMYRLKGLGSFAEVQEALRTARRLLVRSHQH